MRWTGSTVVAKSRRLSRSREISCSVCRVRNDRPRPTRKADSRTDVLPDPLGPKMRLRPGRKSSAAVAMLRTEEIWRDAKLTALTRGSWLGALPRPQLQPHGHHDVARLRGA